MMSFCQKKDYLDINDYKFLLINNNSSSDNSNMDEIYGVIRTPKEYIKK